MFWGRYPSSPETLIEPSVGVSSPAISRSRVDFPDPLTPIKPLRPELIVSEKSLKTGVPSGQAKERSEQMTELFCIDMRSSKGGVITDLWQTRGNERPMTSEEQQLSPINGNSTYTSYIKY